MRRWGVGRSSGQEGGAQREACGPGRGPSARTPPCGLPALRLPASRPRTNVWFKSPPAAPLCLWRSLQAGQAGRAGASRTPSLWQIQKINSMLGDGKCRAEKSACVLVFLSLCMGTCIAVYVRVHTRVGPSVSVCACVRVHLCISGCGCECVPVCPAHSRVWACWGRLAPVSRPAPALRGSSHLTRLAPRAFPGTRGHLCLLCLHSPFCARGPAQGLSWGVWPWQ